MIHDSDGDLNNQSISPAKSCNVLSLCCQYIWKL